MPRSFPTAALALAVACGDPTSSASDGGLALAQADRLSATLELSPAEVAPGGAFTVRFALRNAGADTARLTLACPLLAMLSVRGAGGTNVDGSASLPSGCHGVIAHLRLPPGRDTVLVARGRAVEVTYPPLAERPLGSGTYTVVAAPTPIELDGSAVRLPELTRRLVVR